jgi:tetratricopeptide (TPR) repeat protein
MKSLTDMGNKAMQIKDYKDAIKHYDEALEIDDKNVEVLNARILAFIEMKDFKMAHKDAEYWVSLDSDSAEVKRQITLMYVKRIIQLGWVFFFGGMQILQICMEFHIRQLTINCLLPTAYYLLPTAYCLQHSPFYGQSGYLNRSSGADLGFFVQEGVRPMQSKKILPSILFSTTQKTRIGVGLRVGFTSQSFNYMPLPANFWIS